MSHGLHYAKQSPLVRASIQRSVSFLKKRYWSKLWIDRPSSDHPTGSQYLSSDMSSTLINIHLPQPRKSQLGPFINRDNTWESTNFFSQHIPAMKKEWPFWMITTLHSKGLVVSMLEIWSTLAGFRSKYIQWAGERPDMEAFGRQETLFKFVPST